MVVVILINNSTPYTYRKQRGISSVGRAFEWHSKGQGFESPILHLLTPLISTSYALVSPKNTVTRQSPESYLELINWYTRRKQKFCDAILRAFRSTSCQFMSFLKLSHFPLIPHYFAVFF